MAFKRRARPKSIPVGDELTGAMAGIGMSFAARSSTKLPNIEDTLLFASIEAMDRDDLRVLAVLVTWFGIHHPWVNADRLGNLVAGMSSERVRALWAALAQWKSKDRRFAKLRRLHRGARVDVLGTGTDFQIRRRGEDPRFAGSALRVPAGVLRDRPADVLSPAALARRHHAYRQRVVTGPTYRADLWAALEAEPDLSVAELARRTYASFASAWHAKRDHKIVSQRLPGR